MSLVLTYRSEFDAVVKQEGIDGLIKRLAQKNAPAAVGGGSPCLVMGAKIAEGHHERWHGGGYPSGISGEAIPPPARIMQICDVYDALRSKRPYKPAFTHERSLEIITVGDGRTLPAHFDPAVLEAFRKCTARFRDIYEAHAE